MRGRSSSRRPPKSYIATAFCALLVVVAGTPNTNADIITLNNGGTIRGKIDRKAAKTDPQHVTMLTIDGTLIRIDQSQIQSVVRRSLKIERYEARAQITPNTVEHQWELAEWCRQNRLTKQRTAHLQRIVELDPDHEKAHRGLGHSLRAGKWMTRDEAMELQGYVKYNGRYMTVQERGLTQQREEGADAAKQWRSKIRRWHGWLSDRDPERRQQGFAKLGGITDPYAIPALVHYFRDADEKPLRELFVTLLSKMPGKQPVKPLVIQSLHDSSKRIRTLALDSISPNQYSYAGNIYLWELRSGLNVIVRRAALALGRMEDDSAVPALIDVLVTKHRYRVQVPDRRGVSFGSDGSIGPGGATSRLPAELDLRMRAGQFPDGVIVQQHGMPTLTRTVVVEREHQNPEVRGALRKLTGQHFGYDKRAWRLWWAKEKSGAAKLSSKS